MFVYFKEISGENIILLFINDKILEVGIWKCKFGWIKSIQFIFKPVDFVAIKYTFFLSFKCKYLQGSDMLDIFSQYTPSNTK